jgi:hypothetical protein
VLLVRVEEVEDGGLVQHQDDPTAEACVSRGQAFEQTQASEKNSFASVMVCDAMVLPLAISRKSIAFVASPLRE